MSIPAPIVVGLGEILWDNLPAGRHLGGAPANFVYHAAALGARAAAVTCVGADADGRAILDRLASLRLDSTYVASDSAHPTGSVDVKLDTAGVPTFIIHQDVAWDHIPWTPALADLAARADAVCFGSLAQRAEVSRNTIHRFLQATRPTALRIFDINLRQRFYSRPVVEASLAASNILKLNDQELPVVGELLNLGDTERAIVAGLLSRYPLKLVALTRGGAGSTLVAPDARIDDPGCAVSAIDTVGAGDAFTAAVAMGLLRGRRLERISQHANQLAAHVCTQNGATPPIPAELAQA